MNTILETLNKYHNKLQFTIEIEENACIPFLDVCIHREKNSLLFDWYSKPTSSGRLINYYSSQPNKYKINTAKNLIHKILTLSHQRFHDANIDKIRKILKSNNYPDYLIRELIQQKVMEINSPQNKASTTKTTDTEKQYYSITYIPKLSENFDRDLAKNKTSLSPTSPTTLYPRFTLKQKAP